VTWLLVLLAPLALLVFGFELYALARKRDLDWLKALVVLVFGWLDVLCNYAFFWPLGNWPWRGQTWKGRTVTARVTFLARNALGRIKSGGHPLLREAVALALAMYLNWRDPGHCSL
jgi:hypothetical protein